MNIKPYDKEIRTLLQTGYYKIPRFQRPYSWDKGNIEDFWADVIASDKVGHFIGSMVLYSRQDEQDLFVVDGQQRLTTITIFLAALRDILTHIGEAEVAKGIQGLIQRPDLNAQVRNILLTESSYPYFQEYIQKQGAPDIDIKPSDEERGIQSAYQFAHSAFSAIVDEIRANYRSAQTAKKKVKERLEQYRNALLKLKVIIIELDSEDDAYVVFETLNTRGRDLEPKDLIKNLLAKLLPPKAVDVDLTKIKWNEMIQSLSESAASLNVSTYLHHYWLSRFDYTPERTLFQKVKSYLTKANAAEFLQGIMADVEIYRRIFEPENFKWENEEESLRRSLVALNIFKVRQPTPLMISILRAYKAKSLSIKQAREAVGAIERFHFMYTAVAGQSSSGGVSKMYAAAARDLSSTTDAQKRAKHLQEFKAKLKGKFPDHATFKAGFSELRYSQLDSRDRPLVRYILAKIDTLGRNDIAVDYSKMTVEHIAPQNPQAGVQQLNLYAAMGNLILVTTDLNGKLKNKPFIEKKKMLKDAGVYLDPILRDANKWGDTEIASRTEQFSGLLHKKDY